MNSLSDIQLKQYIDQVFARFDFNRSGNLNINELHSFLNELFVMTGFGRTITLQEARNALAKIDSNHDGKVNKFELFNLFRLITNPSWQILPYNAPIFVGWGGIPTRYITTTSYVPATYTSVAPSTSYVSGGYVSGGVVGSTMVGGGVIGSTVGTPVVSGSYVGQTIVAPPLYEKAVVEEIPAESRIEYVPFEKKFIEYEQIERVEMIPVERVITEYEEVRRSERVPIERVIQDYYAVEYQTEYIPRVIEERVVDYVQQEKTFERVQYLPVETQIIHYPEENAVNNTATVVPATTYSVMPATVGVSRVGTIGTVGTAYSTVGVSGGSWSSLTDFQLKQYIDQVFARFDVNRSGNLNINELHSFLNELFVMTGFGRTITLQEAHNALLKIDSNHDGKVNKFELFNLFRLITNPSWQILPYSAPIFAGWGGVPARYITGTTYTSAPGMVYRAI